MGNIKEVDHSLQIFFLPTKGYNFNPNLMRPALVHQNIICMLQRTKPWLYYGKANFHKNTL